MLRCASAIACSFVVASGAFAGGLVGPFTETFNDGNANWTNFNNSGPADWFASGGPDGSGYLSGGYNLANASGFFPPVILRGQADSNASGGAFVGNWIESGVIGFSFDIRHDLDQPLTIFTRFATPQNNPGAATESSITVEPNTWTTVTLDLTPDSPDIISFGSGSYESIFSNIGNIQIGFNVPQGLAGQDIPVRLDLDNAGVIIPAPGTVGLLGLAGLGLARRRR